MSDPTVTVLVAGARALGAPWRGANAEEVLARVELIGDVRTGDEAIAGVLTELPDVLLLDVSITGPDARAVCRRIREWAPATRVLAVAPADDEAGYTTLVAGAAGAVLADRPADTMIRSILGIARGEAVLLPRMASRLLHDVDAWAARSSDPIHPPPSLTATEREVLARMGEGVDPGAIAASHAVTSHLVNLHAGFAVAKLHRYVLGAERIVAETGRAPTAPSVDLG